MELETFENLFLLFAGIGGLSAILAALAWFSDTIGRRLWP